MPYYSSKPLPMRGYLMNEGITVTELAQVLGLTRTHVTQVLRRTAPLTERLALRMATILGLGPDEVEELLGPSSEWHQRQE